MCVISRFNTELSKRGHSAVYSPKIEINDAECMIDSFSNLLVDPK